MIVQYNCKFCKKPGGVELEEGADMFQVEKWKPILCCNRCGDYMEKRRGLSERIASICIVLIQCRAAASAKKVGEIEGPIREMLVKLTKIMAALVCKHYNKTNVWDSEFPNMLMDKPDSAWIIVNKYCNMVRTIQ